MNRLSVMGCAFILVASAAPAASPTFVPSPRQSFEGFVAINAPRADVPVGALWIDGYGPVGEAASSDNLETVRSVNGITIDKGLQLALTVGLFDLIGIDPRYRDRFTARFTDLTIIRVKDPSRLAGAKGEPRIIEALKAASVIVSTDSDLGLNGHTLGWQTQSVEGTTTNGRTRNYAMEGRDLFIAIRVATPMLTQGVEQELKLIPSGNGQSTARMNDYLLTVRSRGCDLSDIRCAAGSIGLGKLSTYSSGNPAELVSLDERGEARIGLPVPKSDDRGGLYDSLRVRWVGACGVSKEKIEGCGKRPKLLTQFSGTRLQDLKSPDAKNW